MRNDHHRQLCRAHIQVVELQQHQRCILDGAFGWFSSGETRNRFVISTEKTITQAGIDNSSTKLAAKHDIVMASAGQGLREVRHPCS